MANFYGNDAHVLISIHRADSVYILTNLLSTTH